MYTKIGRKTADFCFMLYQDIQLAYVKEALHKRFLLCYYKLVDKND